MAVKSLILEPINLVYVRLTGKLELGQISQALQGYVEDSAFDAGQRQLIDMRFVDDVITGVWEMREFKKLYERLYEGKPKPVHVAILTSSRFTKRLVWLYSRVMKDKTVVEVTAFDNLGLALAHFGEQEDQFAELLERATASEILEFRPNQHS